MSQENNLQSQSHPSSQNPFGTVNESSSPRYNQQIQPNSVQEYNMGVINEQAIRQRLRIETTLMRMNVDLVKLMISPITNLCSCSLQQCDDLIEVLEKLIGKASRQQERLKDVMRRYSKLEYDFRSKVDFYEESSRKASQDREVLIERMKLMDREAKEREDKLRKEIDSLNRDKKNFEARENSIKVEIKRLEARNNGLNERLKKIQEKGENVEFKNSFVVMGSFNPRESDTIMNMNLEASYTSKLERQKQMLQSENEVFRLHLKEVFERLQKAVIGFGKEKANNVPRMQILDLPYDPAPRYIEFIRNYMAAIDKRLWENVSRKEMALGGSEDYQKLWKHYQSIKKSLKDYQTLFLEQKNMMERLLYTECVSKKLKIGNLEGILDKFNLERRQESQEFDDDIIVTNCQDDVEQTYLMKMVRFIQRESSLLDLIKGKTNQEMLIST